MENGKLNRVNRVIRSAARRVYGLERDLDTGINTNSSSSRPSIDPAVERHQQFTDSLMTKLDYSLGVALGSGVLAYGLFRLYQYFN